MVNDWVKIYRITVAGDKAIIHVFAKGDSFAEAAAFTGHPFPATAEAVSDARIVRIPADHEINAFAACRTLYLR